MFWLFDNDNNINKKYEFYQIFTDYELIYNKNDYIYSFDAINTTNTLNLPNLSDCEFKDVILDVKIIDNLISYDISNTKHKYVFSFKMNFIKNDNNILGLPIFYYSYKSTTTKSMPNLIKYDLITTLNFKIYKLDKNNQLQFVIETDPLTKIIKKYFITTDLNLVKSFLCN